MRTFVAAAAVAAMAWAAPALAEGDAVLEARVARVEQRLAQASAREIQSSVDAYLGAARPDASLVGGPGSAGYEGGFWVRGGSFLLKISLTLQVRWEAFNWNKEAEEPRPGGDLSGFSLPRTTLTFAGDATCNVHYYAALEVGHSGSFLGVGNNADSTLGTLWNLHNQVSRGPGGLVGPDLGIVEAWIEYEVSPSLLFRLGLLQTAATRQLMTPPEMQQFVDISLATSWIGSMVPGYSDRNRDYGLMLHGVFGNEAEWTYLATLTNGDGPARRNILDQSTNDNYAYSVRLNWDAVGCRGFPIGYQEGALRQHECEWVGSVGAWAYWYTDVLKDKPHTDFATRFCWGVDAQAGYGSWSLTAAYSHARLDQSDIPGFDRLDGWSGLVQAGFLFPDSAWEVAARYDVHSFDAFQKSWGGTEIAGAVTYYIDGHSDKVTLDLSHIRGDHQADVQADTYAGTSAVTADAWLLRLQWQLAL